MRTLFCFVSPWFFSATLENDTQKQVAHFSLLVLSRQSFSHTVSLRLPRLVRSVPHCSCGGKRWALYSLLNQTSYECFQHANFRTSHGIFEVCNIIVDASSRIWKLYFSLFRKTTNGNQWELFQPNWTINTHLTCFSFQIGLRGFCHKCGVCISRLIFELYPTHPDLHIFCEVLCNSKAYHKIPVCLLSVELIAFYVGIFSMLSPACEIIKEVVQPNKSLLYEKSLVKKEPILTSRRNFDGSVTTLLLTLRMTVHEISCCSKWNLLSKSGKSTFFIKISKQKQDSGPTESKIPKSWSIGWFFKYSPVTFWNISALTHRKSGQTSDNKPKLGTHLETLFCDQYAEIVWDTMATTVWKFWAEQKSCRIWAFR